MVLYFVNILMYCSNKTPSTNVPSGTGLSQLASALESRTDPTLGLTEKGAVQHSVRNMTKITDLLVQLNACATHNEDRSYESTVVDLLTKLRAQSDGMDTTQVDVLKSFLFRTVAHTRDCRRDGKGRGSRDPAYYIWMQMVTMFPAWRAELKDMLHPFIRKYGSQGDINRLWKYAGETLSDDSGCLVQNWLVDFWVELMEAMELQMRDGRIPCDLTAKYLPREGKQFSHMAKLVAKKFCQKKRINCTHSKVYRQLCSKANRRLNTTEIMMCDRRFKEIKFSNVPGRCLSKNRLAWENLSKDSCMRSTDPDRVECASNYHTHLESLSAPDSKGAKGTSMFITEICGQLMNHPSASDRKLFEAQFEDHRKELMRFANEQGMDLGKFFSQFVLLADFSGSMEGPPMNLACALALFMTSLAKGPFKDRFLSFESSPRFVNLSEGTSVTQKAAICKSSPWGGSTDFYAAHVQILEGIEQVFRNGQQAGMTYDELKELVLSMNPKVLMTISDMDFDAASTNGYGTNTSHDAWKPLHSKLVDLYARKGMELIGEQLPLGMMLYWNASNTSGSPVVASTPNALFVSGYSTSIFKTFMSSGLEGLQSFTPWSYLESTLMDEWYDDAMKGHTPLPTEGLAVKIEDV